VLVSPTALDLAAGLVRGRRRREFNERSEERSLGWGGSRSIDERSEVSSQVRAHQEGHLR